MHLPAAPFPHQPADLQVPNAQLCTDLAFQVYQVRNLFQVTKG
jgi:hypothetical protein